MLVGLLASATTRAQTPEGGNSLITVWDFEADDGGFIGTGDWEWGTPAGPGPGGAHSGSRCWATNLDGPYSAYAYCRLTFPELRILSPDAELRFSHWFEFESEHDGGQVRISLDGGTSWTAIDPEGGYGGEIVLPSGLRIKAYTGTTEGWEEPTFRLGACQGQTIKLQCTMWTDDETSLAGWYLDDVVLIDAVPVASSAGVEEHGLAPQRGGGLGIRIEPARPNPFRAETQVEVQLSAELAPAAMRVEVVSVDGRLVNRLFEGTPAAGARLELRWDGRDSRGETVAPGVYLVRAAMGDRGVVRRIIRLP